MTDTDKYEGHTEGPWILSEEYGYELFIYGGGVRLAKMDCSSPLHTNEHGNVEDVNAQLIADAPLLLQEVKRLRNIINKAMQQHGVLEMRGCLFESGCIDAEGQYESGHWEREGEEK